MFNYQILIAILIITYTNAKYYDRCVNDKHIALTFDDGINKYTRKIVNTLNKFNITGTFFINAITVINNKKNQKLLKKMYERGHTIGSHTFSHPALEKLNNFNIQRELYDNELIFRNLFRKRFRYFRPPYFSYDDNIYDIITNIFGYDFIATNYMAKDWVITNPDIIFNEFKDKLNTTNGLLTIQHDYSYASAFALPKMIKYAKKSGYKFVSLADCLGHTESYYEDNKYGPNLNNGISN